MSALAGAYGRATPSDVERSHAREAVRVAQGRWVVRRSTDGAALAVAPSLAAAEHTAAMLAPPDGSWAPVIQRSTTTNAVAPPVGVGTCATGHSRQLCASPDPA